MQEFAELIGSRLFGRPHEGSTRKEDTLKTANRYLVLGSNLSGARSVVDDLTVLLDDRGIDASVQMQRNAGYIPEAFFGTGDTYNGFYGEETEENDPDTPKSLPMGVILMPEMRQYSDSGHGMFVLADPNDDREHTLYKHVKGLCEKYQVPFMFVGSELSDAQLQTALEDFTPSGQTTN